jgi:hypothetical protein
MLKVERSSYSLTQSILNPKPFQNEKAKLLSLGEYCPYFSELF